MNKLKKHVIGVLAAATVAAAGLAAPSPASAMNWDCATRAALKAVYTSVAQTLSALGDTGGYTYWISRAHLMESLGTNC